MCGLVAWVWFLMNTIRVYHEVLVVKFRIVVLGHSMNNTLSHGDKYTSIRVTDGDTGKHFHCNC